MTARVRVTVAVIFSDTVTVRVTLRVGLILRVNGVTVTVKDTATTRAIVVDGEVVCESNKES